MLVKGVDLGLGCEVVGEVDLFRKRIKIEKKGYIDLEKEILPQVEEKKIQNIIFGFPVNKTLFRRYTFPFKQREKIERAVKGQLFIDLPIPFEEIEFDYVVKDIPGENKVEVFCVIVPKKELENLKYHVDSEIFALMRLCRYQHVYNGTIVHFSKGYIYTVRFRDNFPEVVRVIKEEEIKNRNMVNREDVVFSGDVPDYIPRERILSNPEGDPFYNISYGLILKSIDDFGVDFLHKDETYHLKTVIAGVVYLFLSILFVDAGLVAYGYAKEKVLKKIREKEKELYIKYFSASGTVYDPLLQAKGIVASIKKGGTSGVDAADILAQIGKAKQISKIKSLYKISISGNTFIIQGRADSIKDIESFKNALSIKFNAKIDETINTPEGDIRFTVKGEVR